MLTAKAIAKAVVPRGLREARRRVLRWSRDTVRLYTHGLPYVSLRDAARSFKARYKRTGRRSSTSARRIIWAGVFPPGHKNVGDHAQTVAVDRFLRDHFADYDVVRFYRDEIDTRRWARTVESTRDDDVLLLQSSGDFGSYHVSQQDAWHDKRREILRQFPSNLCIQLPTTVYYHPDERGHSTIAKDQPLYGAANRLVLCREPASFELLSDSLDCRCDVLPDFVFYLKPRMSQARRKGALVILREDRESRCGPKGAGLLKGMLERWVRPVVVKNVQLAPFRMTDAHRSKYVAAVFRRYQEAELVVTDMMHGMIFAVINRTPCIALNGGIPHKIAGHKELVGRSVQFADGLDEIPGAIRSVLNAEYRDTDLTACFAEFARDLRAWHKACALHCLVSGYRSAQAVGPRP